MNSQTLETVCKNYNPDKDYNGGYGHYLAEQVIKQKENEELEKRIELEGYVNFVSAVKKFKINVNNEFADRYEKERLIKKYSNYTKLNGFKSLADCPDYAIGDALKNMYNSALKRIKEYENEK